MLRTAILLLVASLIFSCRTKVEIEKEPSPQPIAETPTLDHEDRAFTIAFGSCNHQYDEQPIWSVISRERPDLWIWLGDAIYSDTEDMTEMQAAYDQQRANPDYQRFVKDLEVIGTWDDHDYGANNAGKEYPKREESQQLFLDFMEVPEEHPSRSTGGVYQVYDYTSDGVTIRVILLDIRYYRDARGSNGTMLGEEQWAWLADQLKGSTADVHIIGGGVQFLPEDHRFEKWANFSSERDRLLQLISDSDVKNPLLISGDRHLAEFSKVELANGKSLIEATSSGLTHAYTRFKSEENRHRVGEVVPEINFGTIAISKKQPLKINVYIHDANGRVKQSVTL